MGAALLATTCLGFVLWMWRADRVARASVAEDPDGVTAQRIHDYHMGLTALFLVVGCLLAIAFGNIAVFGENPAALRILSPLVGLLALLQIGRLVSSMLGMRVIGIPEVTPSGIILPSNAGSFVIEPPSVTAAVTTDQLFLSEVVRTLSSFEPGPALVMTLSASGSPRYLIVGDGVPAFAERLRDVGFVVTDKGA